MLTETLRAIGDLLTPFHLDWIQVEVSARCDGRCRYCPVGRYPDSGRNVLMPMEIFERLEPSFPSADLVFLQGWGEPLLHPRFWEMARRAHSAGCRVGFTTNGILLDEENRRALMDSSVDVLGVSVAGGTPATNDRFRNGNPLAAIDANLRLLRREKEKAGVHLPEVHIAYLLLAANLDEIDAAVDQAEAWGATEAVVSHLSLVLDSSLDTESYLANPDQWTRAQARLRAARRRARDRGIRLSYPSPARERRERGCGENVLGSCFVSASGDVSPCVMANLGLPEGAVHRFQGRDHLPRTLTFGNIRDHSLEEIWRGRAAREFRRTFIDRPGGSRGGARGLAPPCKHCYKLYELWAAAE